MMRRRRRTPNYQETCSGSTPFHPDLPSVRSPASPNPQLESPCGLTGLLAAPAAVLVIRRTERPNAALIPRAPEVAMANAGEWLLPPRSGTNPNWQHDNWRQGNGCTHRPHDEIYLHDLHLRHARTGLAGPHRPRLHEALLAAPKGWCEDLPFGLEEGLALRLGARGGRARRERPRTGDPRVRSLPPAGLHLAHVHPRVGRPGRHGRSHR